MKEIAPRHRVDAVVRIPGSKSVTHRSLIAAALAQGESRLERPLLCQDTRMTLEGLSTLGVEIAVEEECFSVSGNGGMFPPADGTVEPHLGDSGTSYRLLLPVAALSGRDCLLGGSLRMQQRPVGDLVRALNELGARVFFAGSPGYPPVRVQAGGIRGGRVKVRGDTSSQFISALLLSGPYAEKDVEIEVTGNLVSRPYVDVTIEVMDLFGVPVEREGYRSFKVRAGRPYHASQVRIEGDCSSASYFWAAAAVTGGRVVTENIHAFSTRQGDLAFLQVMEAMGCRVEKGQGSVRAEGGRLRGIEADMKDMPDMVPTLAAMALFAEGTTVIRNAGHLRHKESDRLRAVAQEFGLLGARVEVLSDGLIIRGGHALRGALVDPHRDHRMAMSLALVGLKIPGVVITDEGCVEKSFPGFWDLWETL